MHYANVIDGQIVKLGPRPKWLIGGDKPETSRPLTDRELVRHGWFRVLPEPEHDPATQKLVALPTEEWPIGEDVVGPGHAVESLNTEEVAARFAQAKDAKRAELADLRWQWETAGINVNGMAVPTDRETQTVVDRAVKAYDDGDLVEPLNFKRGLGDWVKITPDEVRLIKRLGARHVQACFTRESELDAQIELAGDRAALEAIDITLGWPDRATETNQG